MVTKLISKYLIRLRNEEVRHDLFATPSFDASVGRQHFEKEYFEMKHIGAVILLLCIAILLLIILAEISR